MAKFETYEQGTPSWIEHSSADQQASKEFYGQLFGWDYEDNPMTDDDGEDMGTYSIATIERRPDRRARPGRWREGAAGELGRLPRAPTTSTRPWRRPARRAARCWPVRWTSPTRAGWPGSRTRWAPRSGLWQEQGLRGLAARQRARHQHLERAGDRRRRPRPRRSTPPCSACRHRAAGHARRDAGALHDVQRRRQDRSAGSMAPPAEGIPPHWNVYFNVDDVDATVAKAPELGAQEVAPAVRRAGHRPDRRCSPTRRVRRST